MTLLDRVSRALHASYLKDFGGADQTPYDELADFHKEYGMKQARAAILAMRDIPPELIMKAQLNDPKFTNNCGVFWRGIIDAALAEDK